MLWRNNGFNYGGEVVDIGQRFDAEDDVVEGGSRGACCFLGRSDDCGTCQYNVLDLCYGWLRTMSWFEALVAELAGSATVSDVVSPIVSQTRT